jgi:hypothetical protein
MCGYPKTTRTAVEFAQAHSFKLVVSRTIARRLVLTAIMTLTLVTVSSPMPTKPVRRESCVCYNCLF